MREDHRRNLCPRLGLSPPFSLATMTKPIYSLDSETMYSDDCNVAELGPFAYCRHPDWSCYLISISGSDGYKFTGPPKDVDWDRVKHATWVMANATFDLEVIDRLKELGVVPKCCTPSVIYDVLDLSRYLQQPGNLAGAAKALLGVTRSKAVRTAMKGKLPSDLTEEKRVALYQYAQDDADDTLALWIDHGDKWPEWERELSRHNREMGRKGLPVNLVMLEAHLSTLKSLLFDTRALIPWEDPVMSEKQVAVYCRNAGIKPPISMAKTSPDFEQWLERHGVSHPAVKSMSEYRRINTLYGRIKAMVTRTRDDGTLPFGVKYCGATATRRYSGDSGINFHNMSREALYGVDARKTIVAPEGFVWAVVDTTSIEPAVGSVICGDADTQDFLRGGGDVYELCARQLGFYTDERPIKKVDKPLRQRMKPVRLGGEYGQGAAGLIEYAKGYGVIFDLAEAQGMIDLFRAKSPFITKQWRKLDTALRASAGNGDLVIKLPSGNTLTYRSVHYKTFPDGRREIVATVVKGSTPIESRLWGSRIHENCCQAIARDVLCWYVLELEKEGFDIRLTVHDEVVALVRVETAEASLAQIIQIMSQAPTWMPKLPAGAEGNLMSAYQKL